MALCIWRWRYDVGWVAALALTFWDTINIDGVITNTFELVLKIQVKV